MSLNDSSTWVLSQSGDQSNQAFVSGVTPIDVGLINGVSYVQRDSLGLKYWLASTDTSQQLYRVVFSYVGPGMGDYRENGFLEEMLDTNKIDHDALQYWIQEAFHQGAKAQRELDSEK